MQGASAIETILSEIPELRARVFIVWEPVLDSDHIGPQAQALPRVSDARAVHLWDKDKRLSRQLGGPKRFASHARFDMGKQIWDFVLVYPPGAKWKGGATEPKFAGGQVVAVTGDLRAALR